MESSLHWDIYRRFGRAGTKDGEVLFMSKLNQILHKRLVRIRKDLDSYLELHLPKEDNKFSASVVSSESEQPKRGGVAEKFLNYMKLDDDSFDDEYFDDDYLDDEDVCLSSDESSNEDFTDNKPTVHREFQPPVIPPRSDAQKRSAASPSPVVPQRQATPQTSQPTVPDASLLLPDFLLRREQSLDIDKVLERKAETFSSMLLRLIDEKELKDSDVYKRANIDRRLFSKIRGDEDYVPSKKTAISFCLALQLEMDEAKKLLETAGYALSASSRFDLIIMYLIEHREFNIQFANIVLDDYGEGTLSK